MQKTFKPGDLVSFKHHSGVNVKYHGKYDIYHIFRDYHGKYDSNDCGIVLRCDEFSRLLVLIKSEYVYVFSGDLQLLASIDSCYEV